MNCPYNPAHQNNAKPIEKAGRYYAKCEICGRSALAVLYSTIDKKMLYQLVKIGKNSLGDCRKKVRTVRLSDDEIEAIENGLLRLVIINKRITVTV